MSLHQSGEDYLEAILVLREQKGLVRSVDIAQHLAFSKPSVSRAMSLLRSSGHIIMEPSGYITLTSQGEMVAQQIYQRHKLLSNFFQRLGVPENIATEDACHMEHHLSEETYRCLREFLTQLEKNSCTYLPELGENPPSCQGKTEKKEA